LPVSNFRPMAAKRPGGLTVGPDTNRDWNNRRRIQHMSNTTTNKFSAAQLDELRKWIGGSETRRDHVTAAPIAAMSATLDRDDGQPAAGTEVPPLWYWLYFTPLARASEIGTDGHAKRGGFLPPVPLPRRMFAGGRFTFDHALQVGDDVERTSRVTDVTGKQGRSGYMVFVTVLHEIADARGVAISEEHDIVYREEPCPGAPVPEPRAARTDESFSREIAPDPVLLFRYSALTFNGHRIHYDRTYVTEVEGYPGLIVHGPLIATLLVDLLRRNSPAASVRKFSFRAVRPLFDIHHFDVCGCKDGENRVALWARDHEGSLAMQASAELN
jgi:3-methylfumaryl-CoA hydratase